MNLGVISGGKEFKPGRSQALADCQLFLYSVWHFRSTTTHLQYVLRHPTWTKITLLLQLFLKMKNNSSKSTIPPQKKTRLPFLVKFQETTTVAIASASNMPCKSRSIFFPACNQANWETRLWFKARWRHPKSIVSASNSINIWEPREEGGGGIGNDRHAGWGIHGRHENAKQSERSFQLIKEETGKANFEKQKEHPGGIAIHFRKRMQ